MSCLRIHALTIVNVTYCENIFHNYSSTVETMNQKFELSSLRDYICHVLTLTEAVKATLEFECTEARLALKPWHIKTVVTKEIDKNTCICDKVSNESQAEEISEGIGRALLQAQTLRETLSYNISKEEKRIKQPNVRNIYAPKVLPLDKTKSQNVHHKSPTTGTIKSSIKAKIKPVDNNVKKTQNIIKTKISQTAIAQQGSINTKNETSSESKKMSDITSTKVDIKQKGKKNFLVANKLHIKNIKSTKMHDDDKDKKIKNNSRFSNSKMKPVICAASISELTKLIEEVSLSSSKKMSISSINTSCPLHGKNAAQFTEEVIIESMGIVDALYTFNIPKDILKVLRTYHSYINLEYTKKSANNMQCQKATVSFLKEFEKMNENKQGCFMGDNIANVAMQSISVFENACNGAIHEEEIKRLEKKLKSVYKIHKIQKLDIDPNESVEPLNTILKHSEIAGWMSNGIWNSVCIKDLQGMSKMCCIRYNNITQLLSFFEILQEFQQTEYFNTMIEILLKDTIPKMMHFLKSTDDVYLQIYKMIDILSQGLNPKNPILVKTED
ncbi:hypothetical protein KPH14_002524 [Odynerus spinipes]|uniref:Uncharacterized protein n=1 Tax=Odynerus spinipes TaxID=1348599 RepID=A0AAD9VS97_9HYME|nr:hypothetical protein KPH14_002524 [Odynerus spinipes]